MRSVLAIVSSNKAENKEATMKRSVFISLFVGIQFVLVTLQVYKHSKHTQMLYDKQKHEAYKINLLAKKQQLTQELYACKDRTIIKQYAINNLHMEPVRLSQIKKISTPGQMINEQGV